MHSKESQSQSQSQNQGQASASREAFLCYQDRGTCTACKPSSSGRRRSCGWGTPITTATVNTWGCRWPSSAHTCFPHGGGHGNCGMRGAPTPVQRVHGEVCIQACAATCATTRVETGARVEASRRRCSSYRVRAGSFFPGGRTRTAGSYSCCALRVNGGGGFT